jgi:hypothetical protein
LPPATAIARQWRRLAGAAANRLLAWWLAAVSGTGRPTMADSICFSPDA